MLIYVSLSVLGWAAAIVSGHLCMFWVEIFKYYVELGCVVVLCVWLKAIAYKRPLLFFHPHSHCYTTHCRPVVLYLDARGWCGCTGNFSHLEKNKKKSKNSLTEPWLSIPANRPITCHVCMLNGWIEEEIYYHVN